MINYVDGDGNDLSYLFYENSIRKDWILTFYHTNENDEIVIDDVYTNEDLRQESVEISESVCSQSTMMLGGCESNKFKFTLQGIRTSHLNQRFTVDIILDNNLDYPFRLGVYKVNSDKPTADREGRELVAYDVLYDILNSDIIEWYNTLPASFTVKQMRDSFFNYHMIEQETVELPNDSITLSKTSRDNLSGKKFLTNLCELNGCFGRMSRDNKFVYTVLKEAVEGLFPSNTLYPADDLYPREEAVGKVLSKAQYIKATYADYRVNRVTKVQMWDSKYNKVATSGSGTNVYNIADNILVDMIPVAQRVTVCGNVYGRVSSIWYMICDVSAIGNPCLEVGDSIRLVTKYDVVYLYVMERRMKGIQALKDDYISNGEEFRLDDMSSRNTYGSYFKETNNAISNNTSLINSVNTNLSNLSNIAITTANITTPTITAQMYNALNLGSYLTKNDAQNTYLTQSDARSNYQPKGNYQPAGNYLTQDTADSRYMKHAYGSGQYSTQQQVQTIIGNYVDYSYINGCFTGRTFSAGNINVSNTLSTTNLAINGHRLTTKVMAGFACYGYYTG